MKWKKTGVSLLCAALASSVSPLCGQAAFDADVELAYNTAVQGQDSLDGFAVTLTEKTVSSVTNLSSDKTTTIKLSGILDGQLTADITISTDEGESESYYTDGYYYSGSDDNIEKREMSSADFWDIINSEIYMNMTSNYLKMLYSDPQSDGSVIYHFAATADTLGDYAQKLLNGSASDQGLVIDTLNGTMKVDGDGYVTERQIDTVYTVAQGDSEETFYVQTTASFRENDGTVVVRLPDLSDYEEQEAEEPAVTITRLEQTVYATADVNVRAAGDLSAVILGGLTEGSGITETGYTSDGWIQVQYNGAVGYIWGEYISTTQPILTKNTSGTMYATTNVNVRDSHTDGSVIGGLTKGQAVEITGTTSNGWIRVLYNGQTAYVYADYLSWSEPVADTYVKSGYLSGTVTDASYGSLTILRDDGQGSAVFNTVYATLNLQDTIYTGDWVEVTYSGAGTPYTAEKVSDYTTHSTSSESRSVSADGIVKSCTKKKLVVKCSDGIKRSFNIEDADIELADYPAEGQHVTVTWMSRTDGAETTGITALRVSS
jgi:uncharacterized protein YgiM (DUF1202 family)